MQNSTAVISWFNGLPCTERSRFLTFDIVDFYPSITEDPLENSINYAKQWVDINEETIAVIKHCRKSLLFSREGAWIKKCGSLFDVTMGSFDGAEVCEMVGLFLLHYLEKLVGSTNIGLYRDDGLAIVDASGPELERLRKKIIKLFYHHGLKVTTNVNLTQTDFLDVTFNLQSGKYWPFRKPKQPTSLHTPSVKPSTSYQEAITINA